MEKKQCPVCRYENIVSEIQCKNCHWPLNLDSFSSDIREQKMLYWARNIYDSWRRNTYDLQQLKKANTTSVNVVASKSETFLQSLVDSQERQIKLIEEQNVLFRKVFAEVSDIKEKIVNNDVNNYPVNISPGFNLSENYEPVIREETDNHQLHEYPDEYPEYIELVEYYNNKSEFSGKREVAETQESKSLRMNGNQVNPIFEPKARGDYWIIDIYLVPKYHHKINSHSYETFSILFECRNYEQSTKENFRLIKPGKVNYLSNQQTWQLEERGIIEFL
ncbi:hypothetical protein B6N60_03424 [Richelia sinica FACHB-800]|uniref:Uncharacterized protein n=1 Tax=Richelia sinica FACHB-800 TaxID=1357546 RepID=A0A975TB63_9NOST|nr:hypothetical protein [Richelia sinica]QXE24716.1 hypothetical protein B6N60_03424 [Richelia sinica FACHB-800]